MNPPEKSKNGNTTVIVLFWIGVAAVLGAVFYTICIAISNYLDAITIVGVKGKTIFYGLLAYGLIAWISGGQAVSIIAYYGSLALMFLIALKGFYVVKDHLGIIQAPQDLPELARFITSFVAAQDFNMLVFAVGTFGMLLFLCVLIEYFSRISSYVSNAKESVSEGAEKIQESVSKAAGSIDDLRFATNEIAESIEKGEGNKKL